MVNETSCERFYRIAFSVCFVVVAVSVIPLIILALFAEMASGSPVPKNIAIRKYLLFAILASAFAYRWVPLVAAILTWLDWGMILMGICPWVAKGFGNILYQFPLDICLFLAANVGSIMFFLWKRSTARLKSSI